MLAGAREQLYAHARAESPRECCGLLVSNLDRVLEVWPAENIAQGEHEFLLDPREQYQMLRTIAREELTFEAIYHSHPRGPAALSETDRQLAFYPVQLVVVSLEPKAICWFPPSEGD